MKQRILVVEDNPLNLELVTDLLEVNGYEVLTAQTAEQGIHLACRQSPDLILMDVSLPGLDGLGATKALRADPETRHLTIIALTAHAMKGDEQLALDAGCDGYLAKPIDTRIFVSKIASFIAVANDRRKEPAVTSHYAN